MKHSSNGNETDDDDDKNDDNDDDLCSVCAISAAPAFCVTYALSATHGKSWIRRMPLVQKRRVELLHTRWSK